MNQKLSEALQHLATVHEEFAAEKISPIQHADARERQIVLALNAMAADYGIDLKQPLRIDSRGEFYLIAKGGFGSMAAFMNQHRPRTGVAAGATLLPENGWCYMNHFDAERMVQQYGSTLQALRTIDPVATSPSPRPR